MNEEERAELLAIARQFQFAGTVTQAAPLGAGNVNDTYLVETSSSQHDAPKKNAQQGPDDAPKKNAQQGPDDAPKKNAQQGRDAAPNKNAQHGRDDAPKKYVMQRINQQVFRQPELIMLNLRTFSQHVKQRLAQEEQTDGRRWEVPGVVAAHNGQDFFVDAQGAFWRAIEFVDASHTFAAIQHSDHARAAGYALGRFHSLISDLDPARLHDTLVGFHITPQYLANYDAILQNRAAARDQADVAYGLRFVEARRGWASVLEDALAAGKLTLRAIHGDPKVDNIMLDNESKQAVSIVDLDTVKPGLVHYDVGDCLRSCCNLLGEETDQIDAVTFDTDLCRVILAGYLPVARHFFSQHDYDYLYDCIRLIAFELGLRFFSDHLAGNVYFKVKHDQHNLQRALVQFKLTESIEAQQAEIQSIIRAVS